MSAWTPKYTDAQRRAVVFHGCELSQKAKGIRALAGEGRLRESERSPMLDAFEIPEPTIRDMIR